MKTGVQRAEALWQGFRLVSPDSNPKGYLNALLRLSKGPSGGLGVSTSIWRTNVHYISRWINNSQSACQEQYLGHVD